jgi:aminoglycoside phosphotransferase
VLVGHFGARVRADGPASARHHGTPRRVRGAHDNGLPSGDRVQVFAPGDPYFDFFGTHASGPVALFEVDAIRTAHAELVAAGIEIVGAIEQDRNWDWLHFRAPDGNLYELASRDRVRGDDCVGPRLGGPTSTEARSLSQRFYD